MSELINNADDRRKFLKQMIRKLHEGDAPEEVKTKITEMLKSIPYGEVVAVEQELIAEGLPEQEILKLCDLHHQVLDNTIDVSQAKLPPPGHPVDTFVKENLELKAVCAEVEELISKLETATDVMVLRNDLLGALNRLMDVDKHYRRKENLLFPFLEKNHITGPPKVMWGKHDEVRDLLKSAILSLRETEDPPEIVSICNQYVAPAIEGVVGMTMKEEKILLPMCMDTLTEAEWYEIYQQTGEIGFCLYDPQEEWVPEGVEEIQVDIPGAQGVRLPSGSFTPEELEAMLNILPIDITFVDRNDKVKYFSQGKERVFDRNRTILGRDVRMCHPPSSMHIVDQIVEDFRAGRQDCAPFWIQMGDQFIHIAYYAMRDAEGNYLGTVEMSQNIAPLRALEGEKRLLSYQEKNAGD